jgi:hypothetical protein
LTKNKRNRRKGIETEKRRGEWQAKRNLEQKENEKNTVVLFSKLTLA